MVIDPAAFSLFIETTGYLYTLIPISYILASILKILFWVCSPMCKILSFYIFQVRKQVNKTEAKFLY